MKNFVLRLTLGLIFLTVPSGNVHAGLLFNTTPQDRLVMKKGDGALGWRQSYQESEDFYDASGDKGSRFSDGSQQRYFDYRSVFESAYGLTDRFTIWLNFPLVYRKETRTFNADDFGLGDVTAGARYLFYQNQRKSFEAAFDLGGKFPSGDTDTSFTDSTTGNRAELPLGDGNSDIIFLFHLKEWLHDRFTVEQTLSYKFRFDSLVEYLRTSSINQLAPDGSILSLPVGNLKIDWGDEIRASNRFAWKAFDRLAFFVDADFLYRQQTKIESFSFTSGANGIDVVPNQINLSEAFYLAARPGFIFWINPKWRIGAGVEIPLMGDSYPTVSFVESMVGLKYDLEVRYDF